MPWDKNDDTLKGTQATEPSARPDDAVFDADACDADAGDVDASPEETAFDTDVPEEPTAGSPASQKPSRGAKGWLTVREMAIFAMFGALIFCSKLLMEWAPNVHFIALFIITFTVVYRAKALVPLYIFVLLTGVYGGFNLWWIPYLYIWLPLWGVVMLLPRRMPVKVAVPVYMVAGALHGLCYGTLYAPAQALFFHLNFQATLAWIVAGLPWDGVHAAGNFAACTLVLPLAKLLCRLEHKPTPWRRPTD